MNARCILSRPGSNGAGRSRRRGAAMVEGAIVAGMFLTFLVGVMDVAQVLFLDHLLTERVRVGARHAALHGGTAQTIANVVRFNASVPRDGAQPMLGVEAGMVSVVRLDADTPSDRYLVSITAYRTRTFSPLFYGRIGPKTFQATAPVESMGQTD